MFDMRLDELRQDVAKVRRLVRHGTERTGTFHKLFGLVSGSAEASAMEALMQANEALQPLLGRHGVLRAAVEEKVDVDALQKALDTVFDRLSAASQLVEKLGEPIVRLEEAAGVAPLEASLHQCQAVIDRIDELERDAGRLGPAEAWRQLSRLTESCLPLFADYVDFLSGLTLRDAELDERVGHLADALLAELKADRIAIPAGHGSMLSSVSTLFKLRFPEWTVWDVPLAGYDAGLLHAGRDGVSYTYRMPAGYHDAFAKVLYAETYAALVVGPAYACAATLLRLRPDRTERTEEVPSDLDRAYAVFKALDRGDAHGGFAEFVQEGIKAVWDGAVTLLNNRPEPDDAAAIDRLVARAVDSLSDTTVPGIYGPSHWRYAEGLVDQTLKKGTTPLETAGSVRDLLNAAWRIRLHSKGDAKLAEQGVARWRVVRRNARDRVGGAFTARPERGWR